MTEIISVVLLIYIYAGLELTPDDDELITN